MIHSTPNSILPDLEMNPNLPLLLVIAGFCSTPVHKFEDDFVERTMAVIVRDQRAIVEYSVGLNANTLEDVLQDWDKNAQPGDDSIPPPQSSTTNQPPTKKVAKAGSERSTKSSSDPVPDIAAASAGQDSETGDSAHQIDADLLNRFKRLAPQRILDRIEVTCNGQTIIPHSLTLGPAPQHPFVLVVKFEFDLPPGNANDLQIRDKNFRSQSGAVRYALKAKGNAMLLKSNQAPILIRAQRVELAGLSPEQTEQSTTTNCRLAIPDEGP